MSVTSYQQAFARASALCSKSEKCIADIRMKLFQWQTNEQEHDKVISELIEQNYIDELRYARFYVRDKFRFNKWGRIKIRFNLVSKGIADSDIARALEEEIGEEEYLKVASKLTADKLKALGSSSDYETEIKLFRFLNSRGFENHIIRAVTKH